MEMRLLLPSLGQRKFVSAFWTFSHGALYGRGAAGASKRSAVCYVEGEAAFWAFHHAFRMRVQCFSLLLSHPLREILKMFLITLKLVYGKINNI
jgi:hypothetical protein